VEIRGLDVLLEVTVPEVLDGHRMVVYQHVVRQLEVTVQLLLAVMVELIYYTAALAAVGVLMVLVLLAAAAAVIPAVAVETTIAEVFGEQEQELGPSIVVQIRQI
jgi:hypothetical protein